MNIRTSLFACAVSAIAALSFGAPVASAATLAIHVDDHHHGYVHHHPHPVCTLYRHHRCVRWSHGYHH